MKFNGWILAVLLTALPGMVVAGQTCKDPTEYSPGVCDSGLPGIDSLNIRENAAKLPSLSRPEEVDCSSFVMTEALVRDFFSKAKWVRGDAGSLYDWSNCQASGEVLLKSGQSMSWKIYQFRMGSLTDLEGHEQIFYCEDCKANHVPPQ